MFSKLLIVVAAMTLTGAALLGMRAERLELRHQITSLHARVDQSRQKTWRLQVKIAKRTKPAALHRAATRAGLELEPVSPGQRATPAPRPMAWAPDGGAGVGAGP